MSLSSCLFSRVDRLTGLFMMHSRTGNGGTTLRAPLFMRSNRHVFFGRYHASRQDHRHNFSPHFYPVYLRLGQPDPGPDWLGR